VKNVYIRVSFCRPWRRGGFCYRDNGGRKRGDCYDGQIVVGKLVFNLTIFNINRLSWILRWIPVGKQGRGLCIGIEPKGREES